MESIIQKEKRCLICHTERGVHRHHIFFGPLRNISEKNGFVVWLCGFHHNMSREGVHFNKELDLEIKRLAQHEYERTHTRDDFMNLIGRNYL